MSSKFLFIVTYISILFTSNLTSAQKGERNYDFSVEKSIITWVAKKGDDKYTGSMKIKNGYIIFNDGELQQAVLFANVQSIDCKECGSQEDAQKIMEFVKSANFLNTKNMDYATFKLFKSSKLENSKDGNYRIEGNLTIIGYSNTVSMPVMILEKKDKVYLEGKISLNRTLWKLNDPDNSEMEHIGHTIELYLNLEGELK